MSTDWVEEEIAKLQERATTMEQSADNMFDLGSSFLRLYAANAVDLGLTWLLRAAELGHVAAMETVGTHYLHNTSDLEQATQWLTKASENGNASAANTLIYGILIPQKSWDSIPKYVEAAVATNTPGQSTNALCNGAIAKYLQGEVEAAIDGFKLALEREDHFADSEASWWLAMIFNELGDDENKKKYVSICLESGGYRVPELVDKFIDLVPGEGNLRNNNLSQEASERYENLLTLWDEQVQAGLVDETDDEVFLAVNYAELALRGHANLTESGTAKIQKAIDVLSSL